MIASRNYLLDSLDLLFIYNLQIKYNLKYINRCIYVYKLLIENFCIIFRSI